MNDVPRRRVHTRTIQVEAYRREDALWDLVAVLRDVKDKDFPLDGAVRPAGSSFHEMELTVTIDEKFTIVAVAARTLAAPFMGTCDSFPEVYQQLVGLNLLFGFRAAVRERVGGNEGCTHITELAGVLPTTAIQAFAREVIRIDRDPDAAPPQLNRCRAYRLDGPVVARLYPRWYQPKENPE